MSAIRFLAADKLASWLAEVAASRQVLAPRQEGKAVVFRPLVAGETPSLARATVSPKAAVFPACETLVHFTGTKDPENPAKLNMKLDDTPRRSGPDGVRLPFLRRPRLRRARQAVPRRQVPGRLLQGPPRQPAGRHPDLRQPVQHLLLPLDRRRPRRSHRLRRAAHGRERRLRA